MVENPQRILMSKKIYDVVNELNNPFVESRCENQPIEERMDEIRMSQVFTFWREVQDVLESGAIEIRSLRQQIADIKNDGCRKTDTSQSH